MSLTDPNQPLEHERRELDLDAEKASPQQSHDSTTTESRNGDELEATASKDQSTTSRDDYEVYWEGDQDPENPQNWSVGRKCLIIGTVSFITFLTPLASSMFAPGVPDVMKDFNSSSNVLAAFVVSVFVLGFAFGPLVFAPASELYGRSIVYHVCNLLFLVFTIISAVSVNMGMLIAFRFLAGFAGVGAVTIGSGTISDLVLPERRGLAMAMWSLGPLFGPIIGPIGGGFLIEAAGWRWSFWVLAIAGGVTAIVCLFVLVETKSDTILERKARKLRKETGNPLWHVRGGSATPTRQLLSQSLVRPLKILLFSPVASLMCFYVAVLYGTLYILFTTFTFVFVDQYGFSTQSAGLSYLGSGVGTLLGLLYAGKLSDRRVRQKLSNQEQPKPEDRLALYMVVPGSLAIPIGFFIYGWSAYYKVHWIVPEIGTALTGYGTIVILMCIQTYLVDTYTVHSPSAIAANTVLRSILGALLPLCGLDIYDALGLGWGNTLFGFITLGLAPIPVLFGLFGEKLRKRHQAKGRKY